jgi:uncharacterized protein (TIGR03790 family)
MVPNPLSGFRLGAGLALFLAAATHLWAGGGPFNTLVVVNTNSADSVELGEYYAAAHGIPAHHVCRLGIDTNLVSVNSNEFQSLLRSPITNCIATNGLAGQIDVLVLCEEFPTRVRDIEGVSASLFYGFKNAPGYFDPPASRCKLPSNTANAYFRAERAFRSAAGWNSTNGFIAFHLVASNLPTAKLVVDRGVAAQSSFPASAFYLQMLGDQYRGIREQRFANVQFACASLPGLPVACVFPPLYTVLYGQTNVIGYHDGDSWINPIIRTNNVWLAGAYGDYLTSLGGRIAHSTNDTTQSTVLDWMGIGVTAAYGTVAEPCAFLEKFPDPLMGFHYARGFTIGEAYLMAVEAPYQGLFAGDPLAAPFAAPPVLSVTSQVPYQIVTGTVPVQVSAAAHSNGVPAAAIDFYMDERLQASLANLAPTPGNRLSIAVGGISNSATVAANDSLFDAVAALAAAINANSNQIVSAAAHGDRLELIYKQFNHGSDNAPVSASVSTGTAAALTLGVGLAATNLIPSIYPARKMVSLDANPFNAGANAGDTITYVITLTNGVAVTNVIVATQGESVRNLLERLYGAINTNATLMATSGVRYDRLAVNTNYVIDFGALFARTPGPDGAGIAVDFKVYPIHSSSGLVTNVNFSAFLQDNPDDVRPRASVLFHVKPSNGVLAATASVATTNLADGIHILDFIARDGSAVAAQSRLTLPLVVCNESPQLSVLGTNGAAIADNETPRFENGNDFGLVAWGQARTNVFSIRNNGQDALTITNWTTNGSGAAAFQISGIPGSIEAGGVSNFTVAFAPAATGAYQAVLAFGSDAVLPQTNIQFAGTGAYALNILSAHGSAQPPVGIDLQLPNAVLTNFIDVPAPSGGTQFVCTGWAMDGHAPTNGTGTNFTMTVTNHATLTWLWITNHWLDTAAGAHGTVDVADSWQAANITTQITATASAYFHFTNWTGSISSTHNPLALLMDAPQNIYANFAENIAASNVPEWWLAQFGWTNDFDAAATNDAEPDGFFTWQEYVADTDPTNAAAYPRIDLITTFGTNPPILDWTAATGRTYQIHLCDDLVGGAWATQNLFLGAGTWIDTNPPPATNRYYRMAPRLP